MKCPHCETHFHAEWTNGSNVAGDRLHQLFQLQSTLCPACKNRTVVLFQNTTTGPDKKLMVYPFGAMRSVPSQVPEVYAGDYREASLILPFSPKASAAISRRNLQAIIRDVAGFKARDLSAEIDLLIASPGFPTGLAANVDALRNIGNFAAHPLKSTNTGELISVEPVEAEWLLDILDGLFDHFFVQPAAHKSRRDALNKKLAEAGKPPMK